MAKHPASNDQSLNATPNEGTPAQLIDSPLVVKDENGQPINLDAQLESIQQFIADGESQESIAVMLAIDVDSFINACTQHDGLKAAVRRGYILNKQKFEKNLETAANSMKSANLVKL